MEYKVGDIIELDINKISVIDSIVGPSAGRVIWSTDKSTEVEVIEDFYIVYKSKTSTSYKRGNTYRTETKNFKLLIDKAQELLNNLDKLNFKN